LASTIINISNYSDALIVLGTTGECATLTRSEYEAFVDTVLATVNKRIPCFIGTTALGTHEVVYRTRFAQDRGAVAEASEVLRYAAGNFYVNDKPSGAVVGRQPFGGSRGSGTNDKAGSMLNMLRWTSARTIKETFVPATHHAYPHMGS